MNIEEAIRKRRSCRRFNGRPVSHADLAKLMAAGLATPSAGGLHPLRIIEVRDCLEILKLAKAAGQQWIGQAAACLVIAANYGKTRKKYGRRGNRYAILEAGHAAQNIALLATALRLGSVMVGAFNDHAIQAILGIEESPLYLIPIGHKDERIDDERS